MKASHQLHDEIAQALLAVNLELMLLETSVRSGAESFEKGIANTQRLVRESERKINRIAHGFVTRHKT